MFTYYDDQKTFDLCINLSRGYKEKRKKKQRKKKEKKNEKKIIDMSRLSIHDVCEPEGLSMLQ